MVFDTIDQRTARASRSDTMRFKHTLSKRRRGPSPGFCFLLITWLGIALPRAASSSDFPATGAEVPANPAAPLLTGPGADCKERVLNSPIQLFDAIERALCESPKTRSAWAAIKGAAASVGISKSAYLPTLDGDVKYTYQHN